MYPCLCFASKLNVSMREKDDKRYLAQLQAVLIVYINTVHFQLAFICRKDVSPTKMDVNSTHTLCMSTLQREAIFLVQWNREIVSETFDPKFCTNNADNMNQGTNCA